MGDRDAELRARYLDLVELSVANGIYGESALEMVLRAWRQRLRHPYLTRRGAMSWPARAQTMIGPARLRSLREQVETTLREGVPGDYIETGVWRGGACIVMRAALAAHGIRDRRVFCADSFRGLPRPDPDRYPRDRGDRLFAFAELAVSQEEVRRNFAIYGLLDEQVVFVPGPFRDTLAQVPSRRFALIRLDGDMYESTFVALRSLYDRLAPDGFVIVDDYGVLGGCRRAVHDFLDERRLTPRLTSVDGTCVWWRREAE